ncbi:SDR family oxidoreductase [Zavarzinia sp.]|uniref:SDR family oxidoreductase n=1 Tax=Zavarzinia sp. TaxID=2027920 RepID=UPI003567FC12
MDRNALNALVRISQAVGTNPEYVQGGGGNTSAKSADGKTMLVKTSGTPLAAVSESAGWAELDLAAARAVLDAPGLDRIDAASREAKVLKLLKAAVIGGPGGRPSVEASLHALLGTVVIHTHPAAVNALTCGPKESALAELTKPGEAPPLWVPYTDPGYRLGASVKTAVQAYQKEHRKLPAVLLLENHGIFVSANDAEACIALHADWVARCERLFDAKAAVPRGAAAADSAMLREAMAAIRRVWQAKQKRTVFARLSADTELSYAAGDQALQKLFTSGALSPDQIVYTGPRWYAAESLGAAAAAVESALGGGSDKPDKSDVWRGAAAPPRVLLVRGAGAILLADDLAKLDVVEAVASNAARTARLAAGRGGAHNLDERSTRFICDWEVEHYRSKQLDRPAELLSGKIAVVTGAASGLGLGIAQGLVDAGAAVAFCDIDVAGLDAAAKAASDPARALAVRMDVTAEQSVREAFDSAVRHWGGVDILVCAAGIAPAYPLVDTPVDKWRLALEINLTGYFLAAREAAPIMKSQGQGGSMVMISSKSGLEASKANSAYNATKAGELHLMRGWALELGPDGIRVNAVAPGNVFEGSKIWNPEYIKVCAEKKGIRPEEVIPYYVSLTALGREIKRSDVADAVCFLCSEHARCITGQTLVVDSGQVMAR